MSVLQRQHQRDASLLSPTNGNDTRRYAIMRQRYANHAPPHHATTTHPTPTHRPHQRGRRRPAADHRPPPNESGRTYKWRHDPVDPRGCTEDVGGDKGCPGHNLKGWQSLGNRDVPIGRGERVKVGFFRRPLDLPHLRAKRDHNNVQRVATAS